MVVEMAQVGKIICIEMKLICAYYAIKDAPNVTVQVTQTVQVAQMVILNGHHYLYVHKIVLLGSMRITLMLMLIITTQSASYVSLVV